MKTSFTVLLFISALGVILPKKTARFEKVGPILSEISSSKDGCASISIIHNDSIVYFQSVGDAVRKNALPADTFTIFRVGSITKTFTAVLMMQLAEEGKITLDDTIEKFVPEVKQLIGYADSTRFTFRQLASHTSGLYREPAHEKYSEGRVSDWEKQLLRAIPAAQFKFRAGKEFNYSNIGYAILGLAISRAANKPFIQLMKEKIFQPLKMEHTFFEVPLEERAHLAEGNNNPGHPGKVYKKAPLREHKGRGFRVPNGGIYSCHADLSKFVIALMEEGNARILSDSSLHLLQENFIDYPAAKDAKYNKAHYGLGTIQYTLDSGQQITLHSGWTSGYLTCYAFNAKEKKAVVLMYNYFCEKNIEESAIRILQEF